MRRGGVGMTVLLLVVAAGCTRVVAGAAGPVVGTSVSAPTTVAPDSAAPDSGAPDGGAHDGGAHDGGAHDGGAPAGGVLVTDPLADECLLSAAEFAALVGRPVGPPEQGTVRRGDGSTGSSCVASAGSGPVAMINVYAVRSGTPADHVRSGPPGRTVSGLGETARVVTTASGPALRLASPRYLVTVLVAGGTPDDAAWRVAGRAALSRLPP